ncbi:LacI family DNA-binding transcriptional regulator [Nesterenkonia sandarakina]|uniref:LacI family transcriptional regulator n=1 Tax=Nesterenkonia sandarakina TaxID=272918 RepID=A0A7Z0J323_9MICC|nr:LacI family DNA-binding transcriptional regulator [Nesterenkonia sandarakina]NYJ16313.1 LacI family transcriptional regulator [Nesterenkonia sandarakina]
MALAQVRDVAARAGVSPATVSNALNHPDKVSQATRERVQVAIADLGYVRNDAARQLRQQQNLAVGMIVLDIGNPFFADVARGAENSLEVFHRPLLLGNSSQSSQRELTQLRLFEEQRVSGLLVTPVGDIIERLQEIRRRGIAVVLVDRDAGADALSSVSTDDVLGGRLATEHLLELGRRRIAVVGGPQRIRQVAHRHQGALAAAQEYDGAQVRLVDTGAMDATAGREASRNLLELPETQRPDAIFATNDLVALGALQELSRAGVRVPEDIALIGYDDIAFTASATVPISSVRQPAEEMGARAAELLVAAIEDPEAPVEHQVFTPSLLARESTLGR